MAKISRRIPPNLALLRDLIIVETAAIIVVSYFFKGPTSVCDGFTHFSRVKIILDNLPNIPRWNPYWYFGVPLLRTYGGFVHYSMAILGWFMSMIMPQLASNPLLVSTFLLYTYLIFSFGALSIYFLAREMDAGSFGSITSAILLLVSSNVLSFWAVGSYPKITSLFLSPLPLALYVRAVKKGSLTDAVPVGLTYSLVAVTYLPNAVVLLVAFIVLSVIMLIREPRLLYISRGRTMPPKYTFTLPKIALVSAVLGLAFAAWWLFPFYSAIMMTPSYAKALTSVNPAKLDRSFLEQLRRVSLGSDTATPGTSHFILTLLSIPLYIINRKTRIADAAVLSSTILLISFYQWFGLRVFLFGPGRFTLYWSIFASLAGGFVISSLQQGYKRFVSTVTGQQVTILRQISAVSFSVLLLLTVVTPAVAASEPRKVVKLPSRNELLEQITKPGERLGTPRGFALNVATNVWQSSGGSIESMYVLNEFAYTFWYYIMMRKDARYLPYFSKNYNVRFLSVGGLEGTKELNRSGIYEVENFDSSLIEIIKPNALLILHIGPPDDYSRLFISTALSGDVEPVLAYGGEYLEDYSVEDLMHFKLIYISDVKTRSIEVYIDLIDSYLEGGGSLLFQLDILQHGYTFITDILPINKIANKTSSLQLNFLSTLEKENLPSFKEENKTQILYATELKERAEVIAWDDDGDPVIVRMKRGAGWIIWSGINLPFQAMLRQDDGGAALLVELMKFFSSYVPSPKGAICHGDFAIVSTEEVIVNLKKPSRDDGVWFKMTYYPGWEAIVEKNGEYLKIFLAGPRGMLVFPKKDSSSKIIFYFGKTLEVWLGELISMISLGLFFILSVIFPTVRRVWKVPEGWTHTYHRGSGLRHLNKTKQDPIGRSQKRR